MRSRRVRIDEFEGEPVQYGWTLGDVDNGVIVVELEVAYREDERDDGLREVPIELIHYVYD